MNTHESTVKAGADSLLLQFIATSACRMLCQKVWHAMHKCPQAPSMHKQASPCTPHMQVQLVCICTVFRFSLFSLAHTSHDLPCSTAFLQHVEGTRLTCDACVTRVM